MLLLSINDAIKIMGILPVCTIDSATYEMTTKIGELKFKAIPISIQNTRKFVWVLETKVHLYKEE